MIKVKFQQREILPHERSCSDQHPTAGILDFLFEKEEGITNSAYLFAVI